MRKCRCCKGNLEPIEAAGETQLAECDYCGEVFQVKGKVVKEQPLEEDEENEEALIIDDEDLEIEELPEHDLDYDFDHYTESEEFDDED